MEVVGLSLSSAAPDDHHGSEKLVPDYRTLPPGVRLHETIASIDANAVPDPAAGRNVDQHRALRDD